MTAMNGKVALITGAATGIGRATAELFAREGAKLVLADLNADVGEALAGELRAQGAAAHFVATDVAKPADCERMVAAAVQKFGRLDAAFNNAGVSDGPVPPATDAYPLELWDKLIAVDLSGVFYGMRFQLRAMLEGGGGAIVNTASIAGHIGFAGTPGYVASKHGVLGLTKVVAIEYGARGIRCNAVAPGFIETPMTHDVFGSDPFKQVVHAAVPMRRVAEPKEVAESVLWLCSERASYVNGTCLTVDGGYLAQ